MHGQQNFKILEILNFHIWVRIINGCVLVDVSDPANGTKKNPLQTPSYITSSICWHY